MKHYVPAFAVHLFTATGAGLALVAMLAAGNQNWSMMYLWLLAALVVDGIDGPLARKFNVKKYAPQWDGVLLDLIIDYLTYVFIPAYALFQSGLLPGWGGWIAALVVCLTGAIYFADTRMKTSDNSFSGFPGCWNMVVLVFFAVDMPKTLMLAIVAALALAQFFPLKFVHPVRTRRFRPLSLAVMAAWVCIAFWIGFDDFEPTWLAQILLIITSCYLLFIGVAMQIWPIAASKARRIK
ncbi:MAG: phosphatidylcholine synthase [Paracoccaceae bacterium]